MNRPSQSAKNPTLENRNRIRGIYKWGLVLATSACVLIGLYWNFHFTWLGMMEIRGCMYLIISLLLPLVFWIYPARKDLTKDNVPIYDLILSIISFAIPFYLFFNAYDIVYGGWEYTLPLHGFIGGLILWCLVIEAGRRVIGLSFIVVVGLFSLYPLFAGFMPGALYGHPYSIRDLVGLHLFSQSGMLGIPMQVFKNLLIGYLLFGVTMSFTGGGQFFVNLALSFLGHVRGGPAKVAVISSAFFGSISGSAIANIMVTGSFTIPTMKRTGYTPHYAAAVETCASQGGQITPPIMSAVAFIMADWLSTSYLSIAVIAAIPAIIYYVSLLVQVDGYAATHNLKGLNREELPTLWAVLKTGWVYIIAFGVLLFLMFKMFMIAQAPYIATAVLLLLSMIRKETRITLATFIESLVGLGKTLTSLITILAGVGMVISAIIFTGIATSIGNEMILAVGHNLGLVIFISAIACIIMGMGMTIVPCYILGALLLAPAISRLGVPVLAVHFFILYYVNLAGLTPPVCTSAFAAAGLANSPPMKTGFMTVRIGLILFILPIFFILRPELLLIGTPVMIVVAIVAALACAFFIGSALEGYLLKVGRLSWVSRFPLGLGGFLIMFTGYIYSVIGIGLIVVAIVLQLVKRKLNSDKTISNLQRRVAGD